MIKLKKIIKKNKNLILIFILSFLIYYIFGFYINGGDPTASFGFSHAIKMGEIPYKDFNLISLPLFAFYHAFFLLFVDEYIMFIIAQSLLVTLMFYFLFKMYEDKAWLVFLAMIFFKFFGFLPTYTFSALLMLVIIMYLEKNFAEKDYLIGFFIGLAILSKQTIGILFIIPTLIFYIKNFKKLLRRFIGLLIPCIFLLIYLLINNALLSCINLCFLGLFDFGSKNNTLFTIWFYLAIIQFIITLFLIKKDKKNILNYYGLVSVSFTIPIFDLNHYAFYFVAFIITIIPYIKEYKYLKLLVFSFMFEMTLFNFFMGIRNYEIIFTKDINHFKYLIQYQKNYFYEKKESKYYSKYKNTNPIIMTYSAMKYNIVNDNKITYYDVFLYGNHGYNGSEKMIKKIKTMHNQIFIINIKEYNLAGGDSQYAKDVATYVIKHSKKIDSKYNFNVYLKK